MRRRWQLALNNRLIAWAGALGASSRETVENIFTKRFR